MVPNWSIYWFKGILLLLRDISLSLDPLSKISEGDFIIISHAHGDHIAGFKSEKPKLASYLTIKLYEAQTGRRVKNIYPGFMMSQRFNLGSIDVEMYNSGHVLGSSQFLFESGFSTLVYTGDLNLKSTLISEAGKILPCDELIIDATYGKPGIIFPDRIKIYEEIADFIERAVKADTPPVFIAYSIGKAQELIALINKYLDLEVLVDEKIDRVNTIYKRFGIELKYLNLASNEGLEVLKSKCLPAVVSNKRNLVMASSFGMLRAIATGWSLLFPYRRFDATFPLSNHADFSQLVSYVKGSGARRIYPFGYFAKEFSNWLKRHFDAEVLPLVD